MAQIIAKWLLAPIQWQKPKDTKISIGEQVMGRHKIRIYPDSDGKWRIQLDRSLKAYRVKDTLEEAIEIAKAWSANHKRSVVVHRIDGSIRSIDTYKPQDIKKGEL